VSLPSAQQEQDEEPLTAKALANFSLQLLVAECSAERLTVTRLSPSRVINEPVVAHPPPTQSPLERLDAQMQQILEGQCVTLPPSLRTLLHSKSAHPTSSGGGAESDGGAAAFKPKVSKAGEIADSTGKLIEQFFTPGRRFDGTIAIPTLGEFERDEEYDEFGELWAEREVGFVYAPNDIVVSPN